MEKKGFFKIVAISLIVLSFSVIAIGYALESHETVLLKKTVTIGDGEIIVVNFYMPDHPIDMGVKYEFNVSKGTIKYMRLSPVDFHSNVSEVINFKETYDLNWEHIFDEPENGQGGLSFTYTLKDDGTFDAYENPEYVGQTWDLFIYNEDNFEKEVTIEVTKIWAYIYTPYL